MPIIKNHRELIARYKGSRAVQAVYKGYRLVWMAVRSCFGSGAWIGDKPWLGNEGWRGTT